MEENRITIHTSTDDGDDDQISQLPKYILHHILSFLDSPTGLVRMSVLSKNWFELTASFPNLDFSIDKFINAIEASKIPLDHAYINVMFYKYVSYTISRFCEQNVTRAYMFNLKAPIEKPTEVEIADKSIELILKKGVQELLINNTYVSATPTFRLPKILVATSSLTSLQIYSCELPSSLMVDELKFKSLIVLHLNRVRIDEEVIKYLTSSCPLLKQFIVTRCYGLKRFCVYRHQKLDLVQIFDCDVEAIDIEAPNMSDLFLVDTERRSPPCMNLGSCKNLKTIVYFNGSPYPDLSVFTNFLSNFPFIQNLLLTISNPCKLKFSSHSLKKFVLNSPCNLIDIDINTPNLLLFKYLSFDPRIAYRPIWNLIEPKPLTEFYLTDDVDVFWFIQLKHFLRKMNGFKVLKICICKSSIDAKQIKVFLIKFERYELEHIELELKTINELSVYVAVVEAVLWCCRPQSLALKLDSSFIDLEEQSHVVKFTYEKLLQQEDQDRTNIQIALTSSSKAKTHFSNLNSLLRELPHDLRNQTITFIKEEVVQEAK